VPQSIQTAALPSAATSLCQQAWQALTEESSNDDVRFLLL
jgi:hypothetical protein